MALQVKRRIPVGRRPLAQRTHKRERRRATLRRTVATILILLFLAIGGTLAYIWYMGQYQAVTIAPAPEQKQKIAIKPPQVAKNVRVGVSVQSITSPVKPGDNASIDIRTNALAICTIAVKYKDQPSKDGGLVQKTADEFGMVNWAWTVDVAAPNGTWPISVTCKNSKYSGVVKADLVVKS